jgi:hypothetical protein
MACRVPSSVSNDQFSVAMPIAVLAGGALLALVGWLIRNAWSSAWGQQKLDMAEIKSDLKELLEGHTDHGERITALETSMESLKSRRDGTITPSPIPRRRKGDRR